LGCEFFQRYSGSTVSFPKFRLFYKWLAGNVDMIRTVVENEELTTLLLDHGADPNQVSSRGMYAIECAASLGTVSVVKLLLERGASLSKCNSLHHAVCTRNSDENCFTMMEFLLQKGVDINERSWKVQQKIPSRTIGGTALMSAVKKQEAATEEMDMARRVKWLLAHGADPDIVDAGGKKPVDYAKEKELIEILQSSTKV
jgi:ankyrin repeat protein